MSDFAKTLIEKLEALKQEHDTCEDCWYSCPMSGECCRDTIDALCTCGAQSINEKIEELIELVKAEYSK